MLDFASCLNVVLAGPIGIDIFTNVPVNARCPIGDSWSGFFGNIEGLDHWFTGAFIVTEVPMVALFLYGPWLVGGVPLDLSQVSGKSALGPSTSLRIPLKDCAPTLSPFDDLGTGIFWNVPSRAFVLKSVNWSGWTCTLLNSDITKLIFTLMIGVASCCSPYCLENSLWRCQELG